MTANKTQATSLSVDAYLDAIPDPARRQDCATLVTLMQRLTGEPPVMWGETMVGFGRYHYRYDSGREGDAFLAGFAARKADLVVYVVAGVDVLPGALERLGKCKTGKVCLYLKRLSDVDPLVLAEMLSASIQAMRERHP